MFRKLMLPRGYKLAFTFSRVQKARGVNSNIGAAGHVLMWDFDGIPMGEVFDSLTYEQKKRDLGPIWVFCTGKGKDHYHAFCLNVHTFQQAISIVSGTLGVCWDFVKWSALRGRFTLRVGPKQGEIPFQVAFLASPVKQDVEWYDLRSFVDYETLWEGIEAHGPSR